MTYSTTLDGENRTHFLPKGRHKVCADFDVVLLPRDYTIDLGIHYNDGTTVDLVRRTYDFTVLKVAENGGDHYRWGRVRGLVRAHARWDLGALDPTQSSGLAWDRGELLTTGDSLGEAGGPR